MRPAAPQTSPARPGASRRSQLLTGLVTGLMLIGIAMAVARPPWLTGVLQTAVEQAGPAAPLMYVLLCALAAPFHLNGLAVALSAVLWPLPVALGLSFAGSLLGSFLTAALLWRARGVARHSRDAWPAWLRRMADQVTRRPLVVGLVARVVIGAGLALEAFYLLTGYTRRQYLIVTTVGLAVWVTQTLVGVTVLHTLLQYSAWMAIAVAVGPVLLPAALLALRLRNTGAR